MKNEKLTALDALCVFGIYNSLNEISMWAWGRDCYGLTEDECKMLEELCDKSRRGIEKQIGNTFQLKVEDYE